MKIRVIITDGVVDTVLGDDEALQADLDIKIVDFDKDQDSSEALDSEYEDDLQDLPFSIIHQK